MSKYRLIDAEKANFTVTMMCRLLEVARSAYYAWTKRPTSARQARSQQLGERIAASRCVRSLLPRTPTSVTVSTGGHRLHLPRFGTELSGAGRWS